MTRLLTISTRTELFVKCAALIAAIAGIFFLILFLGKNDGPAPIGANNAEQILTAQQQTTFYPVLFTKNAGQWNRSIRYAALQPSRGYFFTKSGVTLVALESGKVPTPPTMDADNAGEEEEEEEDEGLKINNAHSVSLTFVNPSPKMHTVVEGKAATLSNFYIDNNHSRWRRNVENFKLLTDRNVWDGINVRHEGRDGHLVQAFVFHPGADVADASMMLNDEDGCGLFRVVSAFQKIDGNDVSVTARIATKGETAGFDVGSYDPSQPLFIQTDFSTYFGGSRDESGIQMYVDDSGSVYLAGMTSSLDFPLVNAAVDSLSMKGTTMFLAKFSSDGQTLEFSTFIGGGQSSGLLGLKPGADNTVILAGNSANSNFPLTPSAAVKSSTGFWISRFTSEGSMLYSSYLWGGGGQIQQWSGMESDPCGNVYFIGHTYTTPVFLTPDALMNSNQGIEDALVMKLSPTCDAILYATIFGCAAHEEPGRMTVDREGNMIVTGILLSALNYPLVNPFQNFYGGAIDGYVAKISADGQRILYSSLIGGTKDEDASLLTVDNAGNAFLAGSTRSNNFPVMNAVQDTLRGGNNIFVTKISPAGDLLYSTYLGGGGEQIVASQADPCGNLIFCGRTNSSDYPLYLPWQSFPGTGSVITIIDSTGSKLLLSTRWGSGNASVTAISSKNNYIYAAGYAQSNSGIPISNAYQSANKGGYDAFISRIAFPMCNTAPVKPPPLTQLKALIQRPDTVFVERHGKNWAPGSFQVKTYIRNADPSNDAQNIQATLSLPKGLSLFPPSQTNPVKINSIKAGDSVLVSWDVLVDSVPYRSTKFQIVIQAEAKTGLLGFCNSGHTFLATIPISRYSLPKPEMNCSLDGPDSLVIQTSGSEYDPNPFTLNYTLKNMSTKEAVVGHLYLSIAPSQGVNTVPPGDMQRSGVTLQPGETYTTSWKIQAAPYPSNRKPSFTVVVVDTFLEQLATCSKSVSIPPIAALYCTSSAPQIVHYQIKSGRTNPDSIRVSLTLQNPVDGTQSIPILAVDLTQATHLRLAPGEQASKAPQSIGPQSGKTLNWSLRIKPPVTQQVTDTVWFNYKLTTQGEMQSCYALVTIIPVSDDLSCSLQTVTSLSIDTTLNTYWPNPFSAICTIRNTGAIASDPLFIELQSDDPSAVLIAPSGKIPLPSIAAGGSDTTLWSVQMLTSRFDRSMSFVAQVTDIAGHIVSACSQGLSAPGLDNGDFCFISLLDTIRYDQQTQQYYPNPFNVLYTLRNALDTAQYDYDVVIDLTKADHLILDAGEPEMKHIPVIPANTTDSLSWRLRIVNPDEPTMVEPIIFRYRNSSDTSWKTCANQIALEPAEKWIVVLCDTRGHDTVWADPYYKQTIPMPVQVQYTIMNRGDIPLTSCSVAIILPKAYQLAPGQDSIQTYTNIFKDQDASREWLLNLVASYTTETTDTIRWVWTCDNVRLDTSCAFLITFMPKQPPGVVYTPWMLRFRAPQNGPLPAAQEVHLWTSNGAAIPWLLTPKEPWMDYAPLSGSTETLLSVQPNTTAMPIGVYHDTTLATSPSWAQYGEINVEYEIYLLDAVTPEGQAHDLRLGQNYPNPASSSVGIDIELKKNVYAVCVLYDLYGRQIATLFEGQKPAGTYHVQFDASRLPAGMYYYTLTAGANSVTKIMMVMR